MHAHARDPKVRKQYLDSARALLRPVPADAGADAVASPNSVTGSAEPSGGRSLLELTRQWTLGGTAGLPNLKLDADELRDVYFSTMISQEVCERHIPWIRIILWDRAQIPRS